MAIQTRGKAVHAANLGLYFDRPPLLVPERGLITGRNFRITNGQVNNLNVGWREFNGGINLDGKPVLLIEQFQPQGGVRKTIFGNTTDLFQYVSGTLSYITPRYGTGTISVTNGSKTVTGTGTAWETAGVKAGDFICLGADEVDPGATWYEIASVDSETQITLLDEYAGSTSAGEAYTIRLTFTSNILQPYETEIFRNGTNLGSGSDGDRWYATNGVDPIVAWDGLTDQVYRPALGDIDTCRALRRFKNTMVYIAPTISGALSPGVVRTSAIGQPENVATLEAAQFIINDSDDPLLTAEQIGEQLAIYASKAIILAQFVGPPLMYVFRTAVAGYGPRSSRALVRFPSQHIFFGADGQYSFDGVNAHQINTHVWREIARISTPTRAALAQGIVDEANAELIWVVPTNNDGGDSPEVAFVGHYLEDVGDAPMPHSTRDLAATAMGYYLREGALTFADLEGIRFDELWVRWNDQSIQSEFPQLLFGTSDGDIFELNAPDQNGTAPISFVRFSRRPLVDSRRNGVVHRVYPNYEHRENDSLTVKIRLFDSPNGDLRSDAEYTLKMDGEERFAPFRDSGRFVEVEFGSGPSAPGQWALEGYDMDTSVGGSR